MSSFSALNYSGHISSTPATFHGFVLFITSLTSCYRDLPRSISSISSDSTILSSFRICWVISVRYFTKVLHPSLQCFLCFSRKPPFLALTPTSCLCHSPVIDLVMLNSSLNSSYLSQRPFPLL